jgi:LAO/AO transport system kinase
MVDTFVLLMLARTGDSLQGIKKGVLELADVIAVNKADDDRAPEASGAAKELAAALHFVATSPHGWDVPVLTCSALDGDGLDDVWRQVTAHRAHLDRHGLLAEHRRQQDVEWMWATIDDHLLGRFRAAPAVRRRTPELEAAVRNGTMTAAAAAQELLDLGNETT